MQAQVDPSDYQAQATGTRQRLERQVANVRRLKAAIRGVSWASQKGLGLATAIETAERIVAEIESEVVG